MELIHKFFIDDFRYVLDVNTGSLMEIDEITYDVLDANEPLTISEAVRRFENKYSENNYKKLPQVLKNTE